MGSYGVRRHSRGEYWRRRPDRVRGRVQRVLRLLRPGWWLFDHDLDLAHPGAADVRTPVLHPGAREEHSWLGRLLLRFGRGLPGLWHRPLSLRRIGITSWVGGFTSHAQHTHTHTHKCTVAQRRPRIHGNHE